MPALPSTKWQTFSNGGTLLVRQERGQAEVQGADQRPPQRPRQLAQGSAPQGRPREETVSKVRMRQKLLDPRRRSKQAWPSWVGGLKWTWTSKIPRKDKRKKYSWRAGLERTEGRSMRKSRLRCCFQGSTCAEGKWLQGSERLGGYCYAQHLFNFFNLLLTVNKPRYSASICYSNNDKDKSVQNIYGCSEKKYFYLFFLIFFSFFLFFYL